MWGGDGALGSVRMGTPGSQAEHQQSRPTLPSRGSSAPHPSQQATPISALWTGRRRLRKHRPLDRRVLGFRGSVRSQPRGVRGQECQPGPCLQGDHRPSQPEALLSKAQQARLFNFLKKEVFINICTETSVWVGACRTRHGSSLQGLSLPSKGGTSRGLREWGQETPAPPHPGPAPQVALGCGSRGRRSRG